ncbi:hypothetical protein T439DRAFT_346575 [Meredithblackwellia eburnea MCA 4105]
MSPPHHPPAETHFNWPDFLQLKGRKYEEHVVQVNFPERPKEPPHTHESGYITIREDHPFDRKSSENVRIVFNSIWKKPNSASVYHFDFELDDQLRLIFVVTRWLALDPETRPRLFIVAGYRLGKGDCTQEARECLRNYSGLDPHQWEKIKLVFISIAGRLGSQEWAEQKSDQLKVVPSDPESDIQTWDFLHNREKTHTYLAAKALAEHLKSPDIDNFVLHTNTSAVFFQELIRNHRDSASKCIAFTFSGDAIFGDQYLIPGANYKWAKKEHQEVVQWCQDSKVPFVSLHSSSMGMHEFALGELDGWESILTIPLYNCSPYRVMIRDSMRNALKWTLQIWGAQKRTHGAAVAEHFMTLAGMKSSADLTPFTFSHTPSDQHAFQWTKDLAVHTAYKQKNCNWKTAQIRAVNIMCISICPISNTLGDFPGTFVDREIPEADFATLHVDWDEMHLGKKVWDEKKKKYEETAYKGHIYLNGPPNYVYTLIGPRAPTFVRRAIKETLHHMWEIGAVNASKTPLVDTQLAHEFLFFATTMERVLDEIHVPALYNEGWASNKQPGQLLTETRYHLRHGPMAQVCKGVLSEEVWRVGWTKLGLQP